MVWLLGLIHHRWNEELHQNYLQRLSDDIFMWCRESAGRRSRVHFPYGDVRGRKHTHTHAQTHVLYTQGFQCTADSCLVWMRTTHVMFLSIICHTYCTVIVLLSAFIPVGIFIFANKTHNVRNCVLGGSQLCQCVYLCVSYNVQYVCPSCGHFTAVLHFRSALSQLSECLPWIFLTPIF